MDKMSKRHVGKGQKGNKNRAKLTVSNSMGYTNQRKIDRKKLTRLNETNYRVGRKKETITYQEKMIDNLKENIRKENRYNYMKSI